MVLLHAKALSEVIISAGTKMMMAPLGAHHAKIAFGKRLKARVAVPLREALFCFSAAGLTLNLADEFELNGFADQFVHWLVMVAQRQPVLNRLAGSRLHFRQ